MHGAAHLMDLLQQLQGCSMARKVTIVNMRDEERGEERQEWGNASQRARMLVCKVAH